MTQEQTLSPRTELDALSAANIASIQSGYIESAVEIGQFPSTDAAENAVTQKEAKIRGNTTLTINMTGASLDRLLTVGHFETHWDASDSGVQNTSVNRKSTYADYDEIRAAADDAFRLFAPTDHSSDRPIYAALASAEDTMGAAPQYGSFWIELPDDLADRAVYGFSDSHYSINKAEDGHYVHDQKTILNQSDAVTAKAITELVGEYIRSLRLRTCGNLAIAGAGESLPRLLTVNGLRPGYVEAAVFDPVELTDLKAIHMSAWTPASLHDLGVIYNKHPTIVDTLQVEHVSTESPLVEEWFRARSGEKNDADTTSPLWQELALPPEASFAEVTAALQKLCALTHRDMSHGHPQYLQMNGVRVAEFTSASQWHNHMANLQGYADNQSAADKELVHKFMAIQQARVFFSTNQEFSR